MCKSIIVTLFGLFLALAAVPVHGQKQNPANGHYYYYFSSAVNWYDAQAAAAQLGGYLATITDSTEDVFIRTIGVSSTSWIGATDSLVEGQWAWITGEPWGYTRWHSGEPNNVGDEDFVGMNPGAWDWVDFRWDRTFAYVVEWDTALYSQIIRVPEDFATIQAALNAARPFYFDTVRVAPGTYTEHLHFPGTDLILKSSGGPEVTVLQGTLAGVPSIIMDHSESRGTRISGFTLVNSNGNVIYAPSASPTIDHCIVRDSHGSNHIVTVSSGKISDCVFHNNIGSSCINVGSGSVVTNNLLYRNDVAIVIWAGAAQISIANNTVVKNLASSVGIRISAGSEIIRDNIVAYNPGYGIRDDNSVGGSEVIEFNDVYSNVAGNYYGCGPGTGSLSVDPLFCDTTTNEFGVPSASPCIGSGYQGGNMGAPLDQCSSFRVSNITIGVAQDSLHLTDHMPVMSWRYMDSLGRSLTSTQLEVGSDLNWQVAEMWLPPTIVGPDTELTYGGAPLLDGGTYYVRVRSAIGADWSLWSTAKFHMNALPNIPSLDYPASGSIASSSRPTLRAVSTNDPDGDPLIYYFAVYADSALTVPGAVGWSFANSGYVYWQPASDLPDNSRYWWTVQAFDGHEYSQPSIARNFIVNGVNEAPFQPQLVSPESQGSPVFDMLPRFTWRRSSDPDPAIRSNTSLSFRSTPISSMFLPSIRLLIPSM